MSDEPTYDYVERGKVERLEAEVARLTELAEGRLAHFQHSEDSRAFHFKRAERLQTENDLLRAALMDARRPVG